MDQDHDTVPRTAWDDIATEFRERAKKHERSAQQDMLLIVATLFACVVIFAGADKLADWMFKTSTERKADIEMANASAEVYRAIASLGKPTSDFIRSLPVIMRPYLDQWLAERTGESKPATKDSPAPQAPATPVVPPTSNSPPEKSPPFIRTPTPSVSDPRMKPLEPKGENTQLYEKLKDLYAENTELHLQLQQERERMDQASDQYSVEQMKSDTAIETANIKANAELDIAREATERNTELNNLVSRALTRIGAVVMVIWLIKIFVRKRQQSVQLSTFYLAASDAVILSKGDMSVFNKLLSKICPSIDSDAIDSPSEAMGQALVALAKRSGEN